MLLSLKRQDFDSLKAILSLNFVLLPVSYHLHIWGSVSLISKPTFFIKFMVKKLNMTGSGKTMEFYV